MRVVNWRRNHSASGYKADQDQKGGGGGWQDSNRRPSNTGGQNGSTGATGGTKMMFVKNDPRPRGMQKKNGISPGSSPW